MLILIALVVLAEITGGNVKSYPCGGDAGHPDEYVKAQPGMDNGGEGGA